MEETRSARSSKHITEARAAAQRAKLDEEAEDRRAAPETTKTRKTGWKKAQRDPLARCCTSTTIERAIADYLADHEDRPENLVQTFPFCTRTVSPALPQLYLSLFTNPTQRAMVYLS